MEADVQGTERLLTKYNSEILTAKKLKGDRSECDRKQGKSDKISSN